MKQCLHEVLKRRSALLVGLIVPHLKISRIRGVDDAGQERSSGCEGGVVGDEWEAAVDGGVVGDEVFVDCSTSSTPTNGGAQMTFEKCGKSDPEHTVGLIVHPMNEVDAISTVASERSCSPCPLRPARQAVRRPRLTSTGDPGLKPEVSPQRRRDHEFRPRHARRHQASVVAVASSS